MKKYIYILAASLALIGIIYISSDKNQQVLPPTRIGESTFSTSLVKTYTFETAFSEADVVARIEIGDWIDEDNTINETYYEARVIECFKGNIPEVFTLLQEGSSQATVKICPLFTSGNEMLVFLKEAVFIDYESPYWIIGGWSTFLDVWYDKEGTCYYVDRYGVMGRGLGINTNYARKTEITSELITIAKEEDSIIAEMQYDYPYIFSEADVKELIEKQ